MADTGRDRPPGLTMLFVIGYAENAVLSNGDLRPGMQVLIKPVVLATLASRFEALIADA